MILSNSGLGCASKCKCKEGMGDVDPYGASIYGPNGNMSYADYLAWQAATFAVQQANAPLVAATQNFNNAYPNSQVQTTASPSGGVIITTPTAVPASQGSITAAPINVTPVAITSNGIIDEIGSWVGNLLPDFGLSVTELGYGAIGIGILGLYGFLKGRD